MFSALDYDTAVLFSGAGLTLLFQHKRAIIPPQALSSAQPRRQDCRPLLQQLCRLPARLNCLYDGVTTQRPVLLHKHFCTAAPLLPWPLPVRQTHAGSNYSNASTAKPGMPFALSRFNPHTGTISTKTSGYSATLSSFRNKLKTFLSSKYVSYVTLSLTALSLYNVHVCVRVNGCILE